jgi:hypothetical protein
MSDALLPSTFLFRFSVPCRYEPELWGKNGVPLREEHRIPSFGELSGERIFADVRAAWNEKGMAFWVRVTGKKTPVWCRATRLEDSDGLHVWIDTRATQNIHRAGRFCHRFAFLPGGAGRTFEQPYAGYVPINRARENPRPVPAGALQVLIETRALTGYEPHEQPRLGFSYAVVDRDLGWQTLTVGPEFPFAEDPSLWGVLELTKDTAATAAKATAAKNTTAKSTTAKSATGKDPAAKATSADEPDAKPAAAKRKRGKK